VAALVPDRPKVRVIRSPYGHDSFLIESEAVGAFIAEALGSAGR
jgi:homoserine O-acetyltransferase